jgi:hypothetical protein
MWLGAAEEPVVDRRGNRQRRHAQCRDYVIGGREGNGNTWSARGDGDTRETHLVVEEGLDEGLGGASSTTRLAFVRADGIERVDGAGAYDCQSRIIMRSDQKTHHPPRCRSGCCTHSTGRSAGRTASSVLTSQSP